MEDPDPPVAERPERLVKAIRAGRKRGLDLSGATPCLLDPASINEALVVTVCDQAREELDGRVSVHWSVRDPVIAGTDRAFEAAADEIAQRVERLGGTVGLPQVNVGG